MAFTELHAKFDRNGLLNIVFDQFRISRTGFHGPNHWARVKHHALAIGNTRCADLLVVELFALLHDSQRENEGIDPGHGDRAADFAAALNLKFYDLKPSQLDQLCTAIRFHSDGEIHSDPTIQTCWDADRLDMGRIGIKPSTKYLSAEGSTYIESAYEWSIEQNVAGNV